MTGIHAAHMVVGIGLMSSSCGWPGRAGSRRITTGRSNLGLYWHFVDIVWIFLFPLLYLLGLHRRPRSLNAHVPTAHPIVSVGLFVTIWVLLMVFTGATVVAGYRTSAS